MKKTEENSPAGVAGGQTLWRSAAPWERRSVWTQCSDQEFSNISVLSLPTSTPDTTPRWGTSPSHSPESNMKCKAEGLRSTNRWGFSVKRTSMGTCVQTVCSCCRSMYQSRPSHPHPQISIFSWRVFLQALQFPLISSHCLHLWENDQQTGSTTSWFAFYKLHVLTGSWRLRYMQIYSFHKSSSIHILKCQLYREFCCHRCLFVTL